MEHTGPQCIECGGTMRLVRRALTVQFKFIGPVTVSAARFHECACGESYLGSALARRLDAAAEEKCRELIDALPLSMFVEAPEAERILGVSKQALHKNRRVARGFVYCSESAGRRLYVRKSVEQFARTGDGRFPLWTPPVAPGPPVEQQWQPSQFSEELVAICFSTPASAETVAQEVTYA